VALDREQLERWLYGGGPAQRRTQDSPVMPDVWYAYALPPGELDPLLAAEPPLLASDPNEADSSRGEREPPPVAVDGSVDLIMRPHENSSAPALVAAIERRLQGAGESAALAYNDVYVAAKLTFVELLRDVLPLSRWWQRYLWQGEPQPLGKLVEARREQIEASLVEERDLPQGRRPVREGELPGDLIWLVGLAGRIGWERSSAARERGRPTAAEVVSAAVEMLGPAMLGEQPDGTPLWAVSRNRPVRSSLWLSRQAVKVDAATRVFGLSCRELCWAVVDSGIDARHPAFARREGEQPLQGDPDDPKAAAKSRVLKTYDFSDIRAKLTRPPGGPGPSAAPAASGSAGTSITDSTAERADTTERWLRRGRFVDWDEIASGLEVRHDESYNAPADEHGTHVAGILAADWRASDNPTPGANDVQGMCPDIRLYDLRVFGADGSGDEFSILSALQFIRHLNANEERPVIHGVNLSFSVRHEVDKYAAGRTPVCDEANRLVKNGIVVVAAAGNEGRGGYWVKQRIVEGYRSASIADPGNAAEVITVGATYRNRPHEYGVSYFSSRGPTGDGRMKPDLVAPGEKIVSPVPHGGLKAMDGTSQAAPHVSGAAALLLTRHPEFMGEPERVKQILCEHCTDLGRERSFQGAGMLDVHRAIGSV
jgi:serine protease AprX